MVSLEKRHQNGLNPAVSQPAVKLLSFDISSWPKALQFAALSTAVFVLYLIYGYLAVCSSINKSFS